MYRRQFLQSFAGACLAVHTGVLENIILGSGANPGRDHHHRITHLRLRTAAPLDEMATYYHDTLGLGVQRNRAENTLVIAAGATEITFETAEADAKPFYHFAFNIPENKILAARAWQKERTPIFMTPENLRDPDYPDDVRHFRSWNAHSVFFFDPAGNVLEHIARHDLDNAAPGDFSEKDILYASEIAFVTDDVEATAQELQKGFALEQYRGGSDQFRAIGDENGLLLVFKRGRDIGRGSGRLRESSVFPTDVIIHGQRTVELTLAGLPHHIQSTG